MELRHILVVIWLMALVSDW